MNWRSWSVVWLGALSSVACCGCLFHSSGDHSALAAVDPTPAPTAVETGVTQVKAEQPAVARAGGTDPDVRGKSNYRPLSPVPVPLKPTPAEQEVDRPALELQPASGKQAQRGPEPLPKPAENPPPVPPPEPPLVAALRRSLENHPQEAAQLLEKYDRPSQELLLALLRLTAGEGKVESLSAEDLEATLEQLRTLTTALRQKAPLTLERLCFCRKIDGFGIYNTLPVDHGFQAGGDGLPGERVQVYVEVRNFQSVLRKGSYETRLSSTLEFHDHQKQKVVEISLGECVDRTQSPRQDYFLNFQFHVPARLPPGSYTLWVVVKDVTPVGTQDSKAEQAPRVARSSLDFKVTAPRPIETAP